MKKNEISFKTSDNVTLCGMLTLPEHPIASVVIAHGIAGDKDEWLGYLSEMADNLAENNIASLRFDFRGHGDSTFEQTEISVAGELLDLKAAVDELSKIMAPKVIIGYSFGGSITVFYSSIYKNTLNSIILLNPALDYFDTFIEAKMDWLPLIFNKDNYEKMKKIGFIQMKPDFMIGAKLIEEFKLLKPYKTLEETDLPVLTIQASKDRIVNPEISKKYGKPNDKSEFFEIEGGGHGFNNFDDEKGISEKTKLNKKILFKKICNWIQTYR